MQRTFVSFNSNKTTAAAVDIFCLFQQMLNPVKDVCSGAYLSILRVLKDFMDKSVSLVYNFSVELKILNLNLRKG